MVLLLFLAAAAACVIIDVPLLRRGSRRRDYLVWGLFWITGIGAVICSLYKINVPSPLLLVIMIYKPINNLFTSWFY
ncbi:hypothetical protein ACWHAM_23185 [Paenibacillus terrae]|uniref:Uncharacterized protein n=1 Tax=Paenibacillus terrae (strain HPL-003) TaxID=985665 RepID=G7VPL7_PAETH|nr:hypothetical protein [Paenibacillus terrae]AET61015.1 hypothetical protein HPL003_21425 [Paenibacillus terrae HPL-003]